MSDEIKNLFYSATDEVIRVIGRIIDDDESEGWMANPAEFYITEGGQRYIIGNNILPSLGIHVRQKRVEASVNKVVEAGNETPVGNYI